VVAGAGAAEVGCAVGAGAGGAVAVGSARGRGRIVGLSGSLGPTTVGSAVGVARGRKSNWPSCAATGVASASAQAAAMRLQTFARRVSGNPVIGSFQGEGAV
jgi:hypothetical protein